MQKNAFRYNSMNRNDRSWNPWHGCHKCSEGCKNCYMFYLDSTRDRDGGEIHKNKTDANLLIKKDRQGNYKIKSGEFVRVCMTSDFFLRMQTSGEMRLGI